MQIELLRQLGTSDQLLDSFILLLRSNKRYENAISSIENQLGYKGKSNALSRFMQIMPADHRIFFLRSSPIRAYVDRINSILFDENIVDKNVKIENLYNNIRRPFEKYMDFYNPSLASINKDDIINWAEIGFDLQVPVTEPFPYIISAWSENNNNNHEKWNEAFEVQLLFNEHMSESVGIELCTLRKMPFSIVKRVEQALEFLQEIDSTVINDIVLNVRHICMIDYKRWKELEDSDYREIGQSVSSHLVPSTCFFSMHSLSKIENLIEALYHEALHKKLSNLLIAYEILIEDYDPQRAPKFHSYWNTDTKWNSNRWEFDRALYAYHVYVHLLVFYGSLLEMNLFNEIDKSWCIHRHKDSHERAFALGKWLQEQANLKKHLSKDGIKFLQLLDQSVTESVS